MRRHAVAVIILSAIAASAHALDAQRSASPYGLPAYRARVLGVFDSQSGLPIDAAEVIDLGSGTSALTTKTGTTSLAFLPDGGALLRIRKIGYQPLMMAIEITPLDSIPLTVLLKASVPTLPTVVAKEVAPSYTSSALRAFEERRHGGPGHFVSEAQLRTQDSHMLNVVAQTLPGLYMSCGKVSTRCYAMSGRQSGARALQQKGGCPVRVLVDGVLRDDPDLANMPARDYAGVEYYAGGATMPEQYNMTSNGCGVLLLWTRER
jgi:hypothetical protein